MKDAALPVSTALVLRDRTRASRHEVFVTAVGDLVSAGIWLHERPRRKLMRRTDMLRRVGSAEDLREPLAYVDSVLREAVHRRTVGAEVSEIARWVALHARGAPEEAVKRTIEDLIAVGLLERVPIDGGPNLALRATSTGEAAIRGLRLERTDGADVVANPPRPHDVAAFPGLSQFTNMSLLLGAWTAGFDAATHQAHAVDHGHTAAHDGSTHIGGHTGHHG